MHDEGPEFAAGSVDLLKIMMLTGAVIGVFSVFQLWFSADYGLVVFEYTGYDLFARNHVYPDNGYFIYAPLAVLAVSAASAVPAAASFTRYERKSAAACVVSGLGVLASVSLYVFYPESKIRVSSEAADMIADIKLMDFIDAGVYSAIIAGMFLAVGGTVLILYRKKNPGGGEN